MPEHSLRSEGGGGQTPWGRVWGRFRRRRLSWWSLLVLGVMVAWVLTTRLWSPHAPNALSDSQWSPPTSTHWLGTDANGRDLLARVCAGARVSLAVGIAGALISLIIGVAWGAFAGWKGGRWDGFLMRIVDILYSMPVIILMIVLLTAVQDPLKSALSRLGGETAEGWSAVVTLSLGLGGISWLTMARIVRSQVVGLRQRAFVEASRSLGASDLRLLMRHVLPNTAGVILAYLTLTIPAVVLGESFLSYLGLGIQPPQASLGTLIAEGAGQINPVRSYWWLLAGPGGLLVVLLLCLSLVGDGLRAALDPRHERAG